MKIINEIYNFQILNIIIIYIIILYYNIVLFFADFNLNITYKICT